MWTARDIDDGKSVDYRDSQLPDDELMPYIEKQRAYVQQDRDYMRAKNNKPPQYFGSLVTEVGPYQPCKPVMSKYEHPKARMKFKMKWD